MNTIEIVEALRSQEKALRELKEELKNALELNELFNPSEKLVFQHYISDSESQLKTIRDAIGRRLKALKAGNKYWCE